MMIITRMEDKVLRFKKFFDLNFPKVKTFAWQLLKSEEDAEDIAQDIFVKLWEKQVLSLERFFFNSYLYTFISFVKLFFTSYFKICFRHSSFTLSRTLSIVAFSDIQLCNPSSSDPCFVCFPMHFF